MISQIVLIRSVPRTINEVTKCANRTTRPSPFKVNNRFYSLGKCFEINTGRRLPSMNRYLSYTHFYRANTIVSRELLLCNPLSSVQHRNFSFKETFNSAIITHSAIFKAISESTIVEYTQNFIVEFHDKLGLPWWLSIILTTCLVRGVLTFPLALYQHYVIARLENVKVELNDFLKKLRDESLIEARKHKWTEKKTKGYFYVNMRKEWTRLVVRDNCHPAKVAILALVQVPLWVVFSTAFRNLVYKLPYNDAAAEFKRLELTVGGVAWFPDLTVPDSFVIPIALGLLNLTIVEIQSLLYKGERTRLQRYLTNLFRGFSIFMVPVAATVPSCLTLYWTTSSFFGLCQNLVVQAPRLRRLVGIPTTPTTVSHPYTQIVERFKSRFRKK